MNELSQTPLASYLLSAVFLGLMVFVLELLPEPGKTLVGTASYNERPAGKTLPCGSRADMQIEVNPHVPALDG